MIDVIYEKFVDDYNNPQLTVSDVRRKHSLNSKRYMEIRQKAIQNGDIPMVRKMNRTSAKFYTRNGDSFIVKKQFGSKCVFVGRFADETTAELVVNKCKEVNWDISQITDFIEKHKVKPHNYTASNNGYIVQKSIGGKNTVICKVPNESIAQKIVEELRECNWNTTKTDEIIKKVIG